MLTGVIVCFILGYLTIVFEHPLKLDKTVPALIMGALCWALLAIGFNNGLLSVIDSHEVVFNMLHSGGHEPQVLEGGAHSVAEEGFTNTLLHHLGKTAEILIFLIGAMTIVEIIDLHRGFEVLKSYVGTRSKKKLLWIVGALGFILSAIIDNLTATIVLVTLLRKLIKDPTERLWFVSLIVIAANAGGAWSPIGDVTTTMLWIGNKVSATGLIQYLVIPSIACFIVPFFVASLLPAFKGDVSVEDMGGATKENKLLSSTTMLYLGLSAIVFVPVFKVLTHLPPYVGMMLSLGVVWLVSEYIHPEEDFSDSRRAMFSAHQALSRIEMSSILFFLGILMAVGALESLVVGYLENGQMVAGTDVPDGATGLGALRYVAEYLDIVIPNQDIVVLMLGVASAIIDNVPLVAASMGMYDQPIDSRLWHFIAYAAGTGGSMLIIGSAAGVAAMGMERIDFIWYLRKIAWLAAIGFIAGALVFIGMGMLF